MCACACAYVVWVLGCGFGVWGEVDDVCGEVCCFIVRGGRAHSTGEGESEDGELLKVQGVHL